MSIVQRLVQQKKAELAAQLRVCQKKAEMLRGMESMSTIELELELFEMLDVHNTGKLRLGEVMEVVAGCGDLVEALEPQDLAGLAQQASSSGAGEGLDRTQFGHFIEALVGKAGGDFTDWAQLLVLSYHWPAPEPPATATNPLPDSGTPHSPRIKEAVKAAAGDGRMRELFTLFDADLDGRVNFRETVVGLRKISPAVPLEAAEEAAVRVLLSYDVDMDRALDYSEFVHFITCFLASADLQFAQVADALVLAAAKPDPTEEEQEQLSSVLACDEFSTFADVRCHKLFDMMDRDGDGKLAFKDVVMMFHKFQPIKPVEVTARELLQIMQQHPAAAAAPAAAPAGDSKPAAQTVRPAIGRGQFAHVLGKYVRSCGAKGFADVADHLLAVAATAPIDQCAACRPGWWFNSVATGGEGLGFRGDGGPLVQELSGLATGEKRKSTDKSEEVSS